MFLKAKPIFLFQNILSFLRGNEIIYSHLFSDKNIFFQSDKNKRDKDVFLIITAYC